MQDQQLCAIHQPNLFPRLSTLVKLLKADTWVVLDDVQFARRDYQQRSRLAHMATPEVWQWLTLPVHLSEGRGTRIRDVRFIDVERSRRRVDLLLKQLYSRSRYWSAFQQPLDRVLELMCRTDRVSLVAEQSSRALLEMLGWRGAVVRSSSFRSRSGRSERLADLARLSGASEYLCGSGGAKYLDGVPFADAGLIVRYLSVPSVRAEAPSVWTHATRVSALWALMRFGPDRLREELETYSKRARQLQTLTRC